MKGSLLVILWLIVFFTANYFICKSYGINKPILITIFVWSFLMIFVGIFEMMLLFNMNYLENKSKYYYTDNKCYWNDNVSISDALSYKMYMDLYADYSLSDKRYGQNISTNEGCRFVMIGEIVHGIFCFIMSFIIMYFFFIDYNKLSIYISSIIFMGIQFALIVWYLVSVFIEMIYVKNESFWWPPLLWNLPWVIVPIYIIYGSNTEIMNICCFDKSPNKTL